MMSPTSSKPKTWLEKNAILYGCFLILAITTGITLTSLLWDDKFKMRIVVSYMAAAGFVVLVQLVIFAILLRNRVDKKYLDWLKNWQQDYQLQANAVSTDSSTGPVKKSDVANATDDTILYPGIKTMPVHNRPVLVTIFAGSYITFGLVWALVYDTWEEIWIVVVLLTCGLSAFAIVIFVRPAWTDYRLSVPNPNGTTRYWHTMFSQYGRRNWEQERLLRQEFPSLQNLDLRGGTPSDLVVTIKHGGKNMQLLSPTQPLPPRQ